MEYEDDILIAENDTITEEESNYNNIFNNIKIM